MERHGIGTRIFGGFGAVLALLALLAATSLGAAVHLGGLFTEYRAAASQTLRIGDLAEDLFKARASAYRYRIQPDEESASSVQESIARISRDLEGVAGLFDENDSSAVALRSLVDRRQRFADEFETLRDLQQEREALVARMGEIGPKARKQLTEIMETAYRDGDPTAAYYAGVAQQDLMLGRFQTERFLLTNAQASRDAAAGYLEAARNKIDDLLTTLRTPAGRSLATTTKDDVAAYRQAMSEVAEIIAARNAVGGDILDTLGPEMQRDLDRVLETVTAHQAALGPASVAGVRWTMIIVVGVSLLAMAAGIAMAFFISRSLTSGVNRAAEDMERLAAGDLDLLIEGDQHETELGRMARSLRVFKDNALKVRSMTAEMAETEKRAAEQARRAITGALSDVVEAAVQGDFSRRMKTDFDDPGQREIAEGVNAMIETVDAGLSETARVVSSLADGDLTDRMRGTYKGAFADLQRDVDKTMARLSELMSEIIGASGDLQHAAAAVAADSEGLSERAEQQASSLEQTSATMEEISATVKTSADNASHASGLAADAAARATSGSAVVDRAIEAMNRLKEGSARIAEIISVIDGLAFQTNLLALNAAVEAARAGDAGKGFAVVASEVRALAKRSSDAARDIRGLIEESGAQVSSGVDLVGATGEALDTIVTGIGEVETSIAAIALAAKEQTAGIDEITSAVSHLDGITQQNAAMANESASNAGTLTARADRLQELMAFFQIDAPAGRSRSRAA